MVKLKRHTNFFFVGQRPYIQGVLIFTQLWQALVDTFSLESLADEFLTIQQIKFNQITVNDGLIVVEITETNIAPKASKRAAAEMICRLPGQKIARSSLFIDHDRKVNRRHLADPCPIDLVGLEYAGDFCGKATLVNMRGTIGLVKGLVRLNKRAHQYTLGSTADEYDIEWLYLQGLETSAPSKFPDRLMIKMDHLRSMPQGSSLVTLNQARYEIEGRKYNPKMCYLLKKKQGR